MPRVQHACIACSSQIQQPHTAFRCEGCNRRQHLKCGTGISQSFYWMVTKSLGVFEWYCAECSSPTMARAEHICIACSSQIQQPHTALRCEECNRRQHLKCGTGISQSFYWKVVRCLGVFEWSCSACSTSTQSEGNETSQISPQPKRRCSYLDGDGIHTIPAKRQRTDPVSSQSTAPVPSRSTAPVSNGSTAPVSSLSTAPMCSQSTAPVTSRPAAPFYSQSAAPVSSQSVAPMSSQSTAPVSSQSTAPVSSRSTAPVCSQPASPVCSQSAALVSSRSTAPVCSQPASPVCSRRAAPVSSQPTAPVSIQPTAPVPSWSVAPVSSRSAAPVFTRPAAPVPVSQRPDLPLPALPEPQHLQQDLPDPLHGEPFPGPSTPHPQPMRPVSLSDGPHSGLDDPESGYRVYAILHGEWHKQPVPSHSSESESDSSDSDSGAADSDRNSASDLFPTERHPNNPVTYDILEKASARGKPLLVSSDSYTFHLEKRGGLIKRWVCNNCTCSAAVNQRGDSFQSGRHEHNHPPQPYIKLKLQMIAEAKEMALSDINKSANTVVKEICSKVPKEVLNVVPINNLRQMIHATRRMDLKTRGKN